MNFSKKISKFVKTAFKMSLDIVSEGESPRKAPFIIKSGKKTSIFPNFLGSEKFT